MIPITSSLSVEWQMFFGFFTPVVTLGVGIVAVFFTYYQYKINLRLKELQDYVGLAIIPLQGFLLQITNVGRTNLYLHHFEVGEQYQTFSEPILISSEGKTNLTIPLSPIKAGSKRAKFYLTDESHRKFLSEEEVRITPVAVSPKLQIAPVPNSITNSQIPESSKIESPQIELILTAVSYRTVRFDWNI